MSSKLREALEEADTVLSALGYDATSPIRTQIKKATLAEPLRNCDRFNAPGEALSAYCEDKGITHPLPLWHGNEYWGLLQWLFAESEVRDAD